MFRLDFRSTPEYGDPTTGDIKIIENPDGSTRYNYTVHLFSLDLKSLTAGEHDDIFGDISKLDFTVLRAALPGETSEERDEIWRDLDVARTSVRLWSERKQKFVFEGRISSIEEVMDTQGKIFKRVSCESQMAYLTDSIVSAEDILRRLEETERIIDHGVVRASNFFKTLIELHNENTGGFGGNISKRFTPVFHGTLEDDGVLNFREQERRQFDVGSTYAKLTGWLNQEHDTVKNVQYEFWITHNDKLDPKEDGYLILNMGRVGAGGEVKSEPKIKLSHNMKSLTIRKHFGARGKTTRIIPLGGVGADGKRLDISSIPQYVPGVSHPIYSRAVENSTLAITYGFVDKEIKYDDIVDDGNRTPEEVTRLKEKLLARGQSVAKAMSDKPAAVSVNALDLFNAGYDPEGFDTGNAYPIENPLFDYDSVFEDKKVHVKCDGSYRLIEIKTPLLKPWLAVFDFGDQVEGLTGKALSAQLSAAQSIFNAASSIAGRLDDSSFKHFDGQSDYDSLSSRNERTFYCIPIDDKTAHMYIGDRRVEISGGGGGEPGDSFTISHAAVLSSEQAAKYTTLEQIPIAAKCGMTAYYGGAPSRMVCNGYRVLFNVPYDQITQEDVSSYLVLPIMGENLLERVGEYAEIKTRLTKQDSGRIYITVFYTRYNKNGSERSSGSAEFYCNYSGGLSGLVFGVTADYPSIREANDAGKALGNNGVLEGIGHGKGGSLSFSPIVPKVWIDGAVQEIFADYGLRGFGEPCQIWSLAELNFNFALSKRYEPSGGV